MDRNLLCGLTAGYYRVVVVLFGVLALVSCQFEDPYSPYTSKATLPVSMLTYKSATIAGTTKGDSAYSWEIAILTGKEFCSAQSYRGTVGSKFTLDFTTNEGSDSRVANIRITFSDGYTNTFTITQLAKSNNPEYDHPWAEQPDYKSQSNLVYKTYYTTLSEGDRVRNYSVCYDTEKVCSRWVAYPAHPVYTKAGGYQVGSSTQGRTNAWAFDDAVTRYKRASNENEAYEFVSTYKATIEAYDTSSDPIIPHSKQADIRFRNSIGGGYARGHMLPSADRYNSWNTNAQTCYSTNIMAQNYNFNGGSWLQLENHVRTKICTDTLYVVVGTLFENSKTVENRSVYDSNNNSIAEKTHCKVSVPSHCYKLLLRTKDGALNRHISEIKSADELMCIGFIFENSNAGATTALQDAVVSVAEIEQRSGFVFFRNLDPSIVDRVKAQKDSKAWGL